MLRNRFLLLLALAAVLVAPATGEAADPTPAALGSEGVIYPRNSPEVRQQLANSETSSLWTPLGVIVVLAAGGFYLLRRNQLGARPGATVHQRLAIEETRSLGSKQYLAVATYGERKMLIAVCPGRIDLLCRLDGAETPAKTEAPTRAAAE